MKESYQREEYCSDQRKGSLRHFNLRRTWGRTSRPCWSFYFARISVNECKGDVTSIEKGRLTLERFQGSY
jgi:hypothetical protein